jgi:hypothetical protein
MLIMLLNYKKCVFHFQNPRTAANYLQMRFLLSFSDFLGPDARRFKLELKKVTEKVEDLPYDWQTCVETISFLMPYAIGICSHIIFEVEKIKNKSR